MNKNIEAGIILSTIICIVIEYRLIVLIVHEGSMASNI